MTTTVDDSCYVGPDEEPDRYRLIRQVGSGGEATLWRAATVVAGGWEPVAVKVLRDGLQHASTVWRARWAEQVSVLRLIQHPGVVGVHEGFEGAPLHRAGQAVGDGERSLYLVMNWVEGRNLAEWAALHREPADYFVALQHLAQIADVLVWLHSGRATSKRPIIHADLTPSNVIINDDGQAVLVDFGLSRVARQDGQPAEGTRGYWAPEVVAEGSYSPASDRYSFGALTAFVLTGEHPAQEPETVRARFADLPLVRNTPGLLDHLMQMFDPVPDRRPAPDEWLRALRAQTSTTVGRLQQGMAPPMPASPATARPTGGVRPVLRRVLRWPVAAGVLALAGVVGLLAVLLPSDESERPDRTAGGTAPTSVPTVRLTEIPEVRGMTDRDATELLQAGGLVVRTEIVLDDSKPDGTVVDTVPPVGQKAPALVRLVVARKPVVHQLSGLEAADGSTELTPGTFRLAGRDYPDSLAADCGFSDSTSVTEYSLDGGYRRFTATVGITADPGTSAHGTFRAKVDGKLVGSWVVTRDQVGSVDLDLTGARTLVLESVDKRGVLYCDVGLFVWADARLVREP
ncbi:protein kinase [Micromonospora sp. NPDC023956]|uniref:protein kinase domain-containing protein n=1 Tax=Micromonospora sp. NPDC023956 TaxID=3155722 RepID=UPI0033D43AA3